MKKAHEFLVSRGKSPSEIIPFKRQLYDVWFKLYRRSVAKVKGGRAVSIYFCMPILFFVAIINNYYAVPHYRTRGVLDSSGFEHVFVGETRDGKILGFHNWIQFYLQEKVGNVDYQGYIRHNKVLLP